MRRCPMSMTLAFEDVVKNSQDNTLFYHFSYVMYMYYSYDVTLLFVNKEKQLENCFKRFINNVILVSLHKSKKKKKKQSHYLRRPFHVNQKTFEYKILIKPKM